MYILSTAGWALSIAVLAASLGYFAVSLPRQIRAPRGARFAMGAAMAPHVVAVWVILLTTLFPGAPKALLAFGPGIVSAPYLLLVWRRVWRRLILAGWRATRRSWLAIFSLGCIAILLLGIAQATSFRISQPILGADVAHYLNEAKVIADTADFRSYPGFGGAPDASAPASLHGPSFAGYLASSLSANALATGVVGPPRDLATRVALALTFLLLLAAVYALATTVSRSRLTPSLTIAIFLTTSSLSYMLVAASRDPFRLAPMVCIVLLLAGQLRRSSILRYPVSVGAIFTFLGASVVNGHSLALIELPVVMTAWALAEFGRFRKNLRTMLLVFCAVGIGALVGGGHHAATYLETGTITGDNAVSGHAFAGTIYANTLQTTTDPRVGDDTSLLGLIGHILGRDLLQLVLGTSLAGALIILFMRGWLLRRQGRSASSCGVVFVSAATVGVALLYLIVGQLAGLNLTYSAAANFRYVYFWNLLASLLIAIALAKLFDPVEQSTAAYSALRGSSVPATVLLAAAAALGYHATTRADWYQPGNWAVEAVPLAEGIIEALPEGCRFFSEANLLNYNVTDAVPFMFFSKYSRPLFEAPNESAIESFLKEEKVCFSVTLRASYLERMSPDTPLMRLLDDDRYAIRVDSRQYDPRRYYRWSLFRYALGDVSRLAVLGRGARLAWHSDESMQLAGKEVTVSYMMRSRTPGLFAAVVSDGSDLVAGKPDPGDGKWSWAYMTHQVPNDSKAIEIGFGPPFEVNEPLMVELAKIVISVDGKTIVDSTAAFDTWKPGQPLPPGWFLNKPGASLFVSKLN